MVCSDSAAAFTVVGFCRDVLAAGGFFSPGEDEELVE